MTATKGPISERMPALVLGVAGFSQQFVDEPSKMPYVEIIRAALDQGINAFDTSPYYGPSEILLGNALRAIQPPRDSYFIATKIGRVASEEFDYTPAWVRYSVCRSLERLNTSYLDLVYTHDAEFVSPDEVVAAVTELRRLRDEGLIRYVGICGYPVDVLARLAAYILEKTGEPLDAVQTYGHCCIQNAKMTQPELLEKFRQARVECITSASPLNMGLLTTRGIDAGLQALWHPAPPALRSICHGLAKTAHDAGEIMEEVAIRWAMETWGRIGAEFGTTAYSAAAGPAAPTPLPRMGISVVGVTSVDELHDLWRVWKSAVHATLAADKASTERSRKIESLVRDKMWPVLGEWKDYSWASPGGVVNKNKSMGVIPRDQVSERWKL